MTFVQKHKTLPKLSTNHQHTDLWDHKKENSPLKDLVLKDLHIFIETIKDHFRAHKDKVDVINFSIIRTYREMKWKNLLEAISKIESWKILFQRSVFIYLTAGMKPMLFWFVATVNPIWAFTIFPYFWLCELLFHCWSRDFESAIGEMSPVTLLGLLLAAP